MDHVEQLVWCVCVSEDYRVQANKCCAVYLPQNRGSGSLVDQVELLVALARLAILANAELLYHVMYGTRLSTE